MIGVFLVFIIPGDLLNSIANPIT